MGDWLMIVKGHGVHDSGGRVLIRDADFMFASFVQELEVFGHTIEVATFQAIGSEPRSVFRNPPQVGERVVFTDRDGNRVGAIVTAVHSRNVVDLKTEDGTEYSYVTRYTHHSPECSFYTSGDSYRVPTEDRKEE